MLRGHFREDALCPMCGCDDETLFHALVKCGYACRFWNAAEEFFAVKLPRLHPGTLSRDIVDPSFMKKDQVAIVVSVMWAIWTSRNKYTHEEVKFQPMRSMELIKEYIMAIDLREQKRSQPVVKHSWKSPDEGWVKLNTYGATDVVRGCTGTDIVV